MAANPLSAELTRRYRQRLTELRDQASGQVRRIWFSQVDGDDIDGTFPAALDSMDVIIAAFQAEAVRTADVYLAAYLTSEFGESVPIEGVDPASYAGRTRDGRTVRSVLALGSISYKLARAQGQTAAAASLSGLARVTRVSRTEVVDAARTAQADMTRDHPRTNGWRRVTSGEPCAACLSMAGARFNDGVVFQLHGSCSCIAEPISRGLPERYRPPEGREVFDRMDSDRATALYGEDRASFISDGGDLSELVASREAEEWGTMIWEAPTPAA